MDAILNNPFRILGLPITASEREISKQINSLATYAEMGKTKSLKTDFPFLPTAERNLNAIEEAKKQIEQSESKLLHSLFWFWENSLIDEFAIEALKESKTEKAISIWEKFINTSKEKVYLSVPIINDLIQKSTNWSAEKNEDHTLTKNGTEYIVERKKETSYSIPTVIAELDNESNWSIECDSEWHSGVDNIGYGIVFGRKNSSFFTFQISGNGQYTFGKFIEWSYTKILDWEEHNSINKWSNNHIEIRNIENKLTFIINGIPVNTVDAEPFFGNYFGFKVTNNQKISFKNFKFCELIEDEIYGKGINVSSKNFSNVKNLSNLYLSLSTNNGSLHLDNFKKGLALAECYLTSEYIENYSAIIAGDRYIYNSEKTLHFFLTDIIDSLKKYLDKPNGISTKELLSSFSNFPVEAKQFINSRFVAKQIQNIDKEIEIAESARKKSAITATTAGKSLLNNTKSDIEYLKEIIGESDYQYQIITDKLSKEIVQCGIDSFNACKTNNGEIDYPKAIKSEDEYLPAYEYAMEIAVTQRAKERAKENLDSCLEWRRKKHLYSCWFCGDEPFEEPSKYQVTIYKETSRSWFPRRVQFKYMEVSIPRCSKCEKVHNHSTNISTVVFIGFVVLGTVTGQLSDGYWFLGLLVGGLVGWLIGAELKKQQLEKAAIKNTKESTVMNYPKLTELRLQGWTFSKPRA
jgi:hypothetical protein